MRWKRFLIFTILVIIVPPPLTASAADPILACESSTSGPITGSARGELLTAEATMLGNAISVTPSRWEPSDRSLTGSLTYYFVYTRKVGELSWKCTNSISQYITVGSINSAIGHDVAVVAYRGGWWSNIVNLVVPAGTNTKKQVCIPESKFLGGLSGEGQPSKKDYQVWAYSKNSNRFALMLLNDKEHPEAEGVSYSSKYIVEYSIDNWKTKAVVKSSRGYNLVSFGALSRTAPHKVRAFVDISDRIEYVQNWIPDPKHSKLGKWVNSDQKIEFTVEGCKSTEAIFYPKEVRKNSSICDSYDLDCPVVLVPGENAESTSEDEKSTIKCVKGTMSKKVTGIKPKCPSGYKIKK